MKQSTKRKRLINAFDKVREKGKMTMQQYLDALVDGQKKGLKGQEYTMYVRDIFAAFLSDLGCYKITDAVYVEGDGSSLQVFKEEMKRVLKENGTPNSYYLFRQ